MNPAPTNFWMNPGSVTGRLPSFGALAPSRPVLQNGFQVPGRSAFGVGSQLPGNFNQGGLNQYNGFSMGPSFQALTAPTGNQVVQRRERILDAYSHARSFPPQMNTNQVGETLSSFRGPTSQIGVSFGLSPGLQPVNQQTMFPGLNTPNTGPAFSLRPSVLQPSPGPFGLTPKAQLVGIKFPTTLVRQPPSFPLSSVQISPPFNPTLTFPLITQRTGANPGFPSNVPVAPQPGQNTNLNFPSNVPVAPQPSDPSRGATTSAPTPTRRFVLCPVLNDPGV